MNESLTSLQSRSALLRLSRPDFLRHGINFPEYKAVTVGNAGAIWTEAGSLAISRSRRPFRTPIQPALGPLCARCTHEPVLHFIVCAQHVQRCSEQASRYNIRLSNRTGRLWWMTEQNKDGVSMRCPWRTFNLSFLFLYIFFIMLILSFLNDRLCRIYLFFSAAIFTVLTARC